MILSPKIIVAALLWLAATGVGAQTCKTDSIPATTPTARFTVHGDGTVTDTKTRLMWKQCSEGQSGADCSAGGVSAYNWQGALQQAQALNAGGGFAGYSDWRLPNIKELRSIVERQCFNPAINTAAFPNTPSAWYAWYWSSSPHALSDGAWVVHFVDGNDFWMLSTYNYYVRLVRSGQ